MAISVCLNFYIANNVALYSTEGNDMLIKNQESGKQISCLQVLTLKTCQNVKVKLWLKKEIIMNLLCFILYQQMKKMMQLKEDLENEKLKCYIKKIFIRMLVTLLVAGN